MSIRNLSILLSLIVTATGCGGGEPSATPFPRDQSASPDSSAQDEDTSSDNEMGAVGEGWGDLTLTFVYDGEPPAREPINLIVDAEFCGRTPPLDESLIVNPENRGIANVVVMLEVEQGEELPPIHESFADMAEAIIELKHQRCAFVPHIAVLRVGQILLLHNTDEVRHSARCMALNNPGFNPLMPPNSELSITSFSQSERLPVSIRCGHHPWMSARLVVKNHPYVGVSDENGKVVIENLPAGAFQFVIWHERIGYVLNPVREGEEVAWLHGRAVFTITADDENDQGTFSVPASVFERR